MRHRWLVAFTETGIRQLRDLPPANRMSVFRVLRALLQAENPLAAHGVKKLKAIRGDSQHRARAGDYRILFSLDTTPREHLSIEYQGTLTVVSIRHRSSAYQP